MGVREFRSDIQRQEDALTKVLRQGAPGLPANAAQAISNQRSQPTSRCSPRANRLRRPGAWRWTGGHTHRERLAQEALQPSPGAYAVVRRTWRPGDVVDLSLDLSPHFWAGERELECRTSIYRGPILLAYDRVFNEMDPDDVPVLDVSDVGGEAVGRECHVKPWMLFRVRAKDGRDTMLCDYASAGATGTPYRSWLPVEGVSPTPFSRENPMRIVRR